MNSLKQQNKDGTAKAGKTPICKITIVLSIFLSLGSNNIATAGDSSDKSNFLLFLPAIIAGSRKEPPPPPVPPAPAPAPTPAQSIEILHNSSHNDGAYVAVVGEVWNNTNDVRKYVKIIVNFFDGSGRFVGSDYTYTKIDNLPPNSKTCFKAYFQDSNHAVSSYSFESVSSSISDKLPPNLTVTQSSVTYDASYDWMEYVGMVRNDAGRTVEYVSPIITLYDQNGTVVNCDYTFTNTTDLLPGQSSSFDSYVTGGNLKSVTSYRLQVDGI